MSHSIVYIGCYTQGMDAAIKVVAFDNQTGQLNEISSVSKLPDTSFLALSKDKTNLFAVSEHERHGELGYFDISEPESPVYINKKSTLGGSPCHISLTKDKVFVSNYGTGNISAFSVTQKQLEPAYTQVQHHGQSIDLNRQATAHVHASQLSVDEQFLVVADLGIDALNVYRITDKQLLLATTVSLTPGSGPRHLVFNAYGDKLYLGNELNNEVAVFSFNQETGALSLLQLIASLPNECRVESAIAEVALSKDGRYLYVSNRGHDSITTFSVAQQTGLLSVIDNIKTGGLFPRHFALSPDQDWLLVAHQYSDYLHLFKRDNHSGLLTRATHMLAVKNAVCVCFL